MEGPIAMDDSEIDYYENDSLKEFLQANLAVNIGFKRFIGDYSWRVAVYNI